MECCCYLRNVQDLLADGKTPHKRRSGEPFKGPIIPFGAVVEYHPISIRDQFRLHQFGKRVLPGIFLGYALIAVRIWKGDILIADQKNWRQWTHQKHTHDESMQKRSIDFTKGRRICIPNRRWYSKLSGRDFEFQEPTPRRERTVWGEDSSGELQGESEESQPTEPTDGAEARNDFRSFQGDFIYRHHAEPRVQLRAEKKNIHHSTEE